MNKTYTQKKNRYISIKETRWKKVGQQEQEGLREGNGDDDNHNILKVCMQ